MGLVLKDFNLNDKFNLLGDYDEQLEDFIPYFKEMMHIEDEYIKSINLKKGKLLKLFIQYFIKQTK